MKSFHSAIALCVAVAVLAVPTSVCQAQSVAGRVLSSSADGVVQGECQAAWVVICRDKRILKKQDKLLENGRFDLSFESAGRAFDVVVGATEMTPVTIRGLAAESGEKLNLTVTLQRMADALRPPQTRKKLFDRKTSDALDVLPAGSDEARSILEGLKRLERKQPLSILVPAYFYPGGATAQDWEEVFWAATQLPDEAELIVIVNVQNGPGNPLQPDANYRDVIARLAKSGAKPVGYVPADYGKRNSKDVQSDVGAWIKAYPGISGIFLDQVSAQQQHVAHFIGLCEGARKVLKNVKRPLIIGNAGAACDEGYAGKGGFDMLCISESKWGAHQIERPAWDDSASGAASAASWTRLGAILYAVQDDKSLGAAFELVTSQGMSFIFVSDQAGGANEVLWTRIPDKTGIWRPFVQRVKAWNQAASAKK